MSEFTATKNWADKIKNKINSVNTIISVSYNSVGCFSAFLYSPVIKAAKAYLQSLFAGTSPTQLLGQEIGNALYDMFNSNFNSFLSNLQTLVNSYETSLGVAQKQAAYNAIASQLTATPAAKCTTAKAFYGSQGALYTVLLRLGSGGSYVPLTMVCPYYCNRGPNRGQYVISSQDKATAQQNISRCQNFVSYLQGIVSSEVNKLNTDSSTVNSFNWKLQQSGCVPSSNKVITRRPDVLAVETIHNKLNEFEASLRGQVDNYNINARVRQGIESNPTLTNIRSIYNTATNVLNTNPFFSCSFEGSTVANYLRSAIPISTLKFTSTLSSNTDLFLKMVSAALCTDYTQSRLPNTVKELKDFISLFNGFKPKVETLYSSVIVPKFQNLLNQITNKTQGLSTVIGLLSNALNAASSSLANTVADCPAGSGATSSSGFGSGLRQL
jgi:hypothetical protein